MSCPATDRDDEGPPLLAGMSALADSFDGYILDLWGVLHDGVQAFPHALDMKTSSRLRSRVQPTCAGIRVTSQL